MTEPDRVELTSSEARAQGELVACPTFNSYSVGTSPETATRVAQESSGDDYNDEISSVPDGHEFEFPVVSPDVSVPGIFSDGGRRIGPVFPIFNRRLLFNDGYADGVIHSGKQSTGNNAAGVETAITSMEALLRERHPPSSSSSSSSEVDELDGIPSDSYCVWTPKKPESSSPSPSLGNKSSSTGSTFKRWKLPNLLSRSNSEGKDCYVMLPPRHASPKTQPPPSPRDDKVNDDATTTRRQKAAAPSLPALYVLRDRASDKKKSYLPYKQDIVGVFARANRLSWTFPRI